MKTLLKCLLATVRTGVATGAVMCVLVPFQRSVGAQSIRADNTLTTVGDVVTADNQNFSITGGTQLGNSLFHGFDVFSIPTNGSAVFDNSASVTNIFSQVTGTQASVIDGLISANGADTNIFFLNRNGITFGPNAELQIGGSFLASTAERLLFDNNVEFGADTSSLDPLLSISTPIGLQIGPSSGSVAVADTGYTTIPTIAYPNVRLDSSMGLGMNAGRTLALIGNAVDFDGGVLTSAGGHIEIGSVGEGTVNFDSRDWRFDYTDVQRFSDIDFLARSLIDTSSLLFDSTGAPYAVNTQGGSIQLQGNHLTFQDASRALIQNYGTQTAGNIRVTASDVLELAGASSTGEYGSSLLTTNFSSGDGGHIDVVAPRLLLAGNATIGTLTFGSASGGNVTVDAKETIRFEGNQELLPDYGQILTNSFVTGASGELVVSTGDLVILGLGIFSQAAGASSGTLVSVEADNITIENAGSIAASTFSSGKGGLVEVTADRITLESGGNIAASTLASGEGGDVNVTADTINIRGTNPVSLVPSTISAPTVSTGNAGDVTVNARQIFLAEGGRIDSSALAQGDSGIVRVTALESLLVDGTVTGQPLPSLIISSANIPNNEQRQFFASIGVILPPIPSGVSGSVIIEAPSIAVTNSAQITVRNDGTGDAGTLSVDADSVYLSDRGSVTASTQAGNGGNLMISLQDPLLLRRGSRISAEANGTGDGGSVALNTPFIIASENSDITASAIQGSGGNIQINALAILGTQFREQLTPESDITASSQFGASGVVEINDLESDLNTKTAPLPEDLADSGDHFAVGCANTTTNQFIATGRGGLPSNPTNTLTSSRPWADIRMFLSESEAVSSNIDISTRFEARPVEAAAWTTLESGEIVLTAPSHHTQSMSFANCLSNHFNKSETVQSIV